jgi:flagellar biosynthetic protein FliR
MRGLPLENIMPYLTDYHVVPYILIFARVGFLFGMLGFFIGSTVPVKFKVVAVFWLTIFYSTVMLDEGRVQTINAMLEKRGLIELLLNEFLIALLIVSVLNLFVYMYKTLGEFVSFSAGLSMAQIYDPSSGTQDQVFNKLFWIMSLYVFFQSGLYYILLEGISGVLSSIEFGTVLLSELNYVEFYSNKLSELMSMVFVLSFPFFILTSSVDLFFGYITRNTPAFNIFSIAFQLKVGVLFVFFAISIDTFLVQYREMFMSLQYFN